MPTQKRRRPTSPVRLLPLLLLAACGGPGSEPDDAVTAKLPPVAARAPHQLAPAPPASPAVTDIGPLRLEAPPQNASREPASSDYTSLDPASCARVDGPAPGDRGVRHRCAGALGYALETSEDGQQGFAIISPDGRRAPLGLAKLANSAQLGRTAEWRRDASGKPRALIVRVTGAGANGRVSDLIVARLTAPACIVATIPRGPRQNEKARIIADGERLDCSKE